VRQHSDRLSVAVVRDFIDSVSEPDIARLMTAAALGFAAMQYRREGLAQEASLNLLSASADAVIVFYSVRISPICILQSIRVRLGRRYAHAPVAAHCYIDLGDAHFEFCQIRLPANPPNISTMRGVAGRFCRLRDNIRALRHFKYLAHGCAVAHHVSRLKEPVVRLIPK